MTGVPVQVRGVDPMEGPTHVRNEGGRRDVHETRRSGCGPYGHGEPGVWDDENSLSGEGSPKTRRQCSGCNLREGHSCLPGTSVSAGDHSRRKGVTGEDPTSRGGPSTAGGTGTSSSGQQGQGW